jgi:ABC-type sugar transport system, ATPase component
MMVGRAIDQLFPKAETVPGEVALELRGLCCGEAVRDIDLTLRAGEILGIAGLIGSGRTELALTIFGITPATSGEILVKGKPVSIRSPSAARSLGIAYVPEDRGLQGLIRPQTVRENISLTILDRISRALLVDRGKENAGPGCDRALRHPRPRAGADCGSSPAAISRKSCWPNGWRPSPRC